ncbi:hypothetical protein MAPG_03411 [Magnaporthiopsis poae ATCC 64411]|uniref:Uncharacterized protein n=1 Tax=Magnaporthiopsis poae (strain ATCC 64411 / 73-15) TaxID=644358 RepID=A0A0C4DTY2_MAGP6|nr:hypothetical protein MAPG_03411 [Magnaporthiopsis poae ATCC 64411]
MALIIPLNVPEVNASSLRPPIRYLDRVKPAKRCIPCPVSLYNPNGWQSPRAAAAPGEVELSWVMVPTGYPHQSAAESRGWDRGGGFAGPPDPPTLAVAIPFPPRKSSSRHRPLARQPMSGDLHAMYHIHDEGREWTDDASGLSSRRGRGPPRCCAATAAVAPLALRGGDGRAMGTPAGVDGRGGGGAHVAEGRGILGTRSRTTTPGTGRVEPKRASFRTRMGLGDGAGEYSGRRVASPY